MSTNNPLWFKISVEGYTHSYDQFRYVHLDMSRGRAALMTLTKQTMVDYLINGGHLSFTREELERMDLHAEFVPSDDPDIENWVTASTVRQRLQNKFYKDIEWNWRKGRSNTFALQIRDEYDEACLAILEDLGYKTEKTGDGRCFVSW